MTDIKDFFWICPKCEAKVNAIEQIARNLFDEDDGEAFFNVGENEGVPKHAIFCSNCDTYWWISIGGMNGEGKKNKRTK